jgi:hypothetical protein
VCAATQSRVTLKSVNISDSNVEFDGGALVVETNAVLKITSTTITNATGALHLLYAALRMHEFKICVMSQWIAQYNITVGSEAY